MMIVRVSVGRVGHQVSIRGFCQPAHLSLLHHHRLATRRCVLIDAREEVLGDPQGILQERVVRVAAGCVLQ